MDVEVIAVSGAGVTIRIGRRRYLMDFDGFPWFRDATIGEIMNVTRPYPEELRWPDLDLDLEVDSVRHPERYPLIARQRRDRASRVAER